MTFILKRLLDLFSKKTNKVDSILAFYEKNGWYKYPGNKEILEKVFADYQPGYFIPYCHYNEDMDTIDVYFKSDPPYTQLLNKELNLFLSQETDEVIGVSVLNAKRLLS
jgi:hypothetical protein